MYNYIKPLSYHIYYCSSYDKDHYPEKLLKQNYFIPSIDYNGNIIKCNNNSINNYNDEGWLSLRYCDYPQMIIIQLTSISEISNILFKLNPTKSSQKIEIYGYSPFSFKEIITDLPSVINADYTYLSSVYPIYNPNKIEETKVVLKDRNKDISQYLNIQEKRKFLTLKRCLYIKLIIHRNYEDPENNRFNQVGLLSLDIYGYDNSERKKTPIYPIKTYEKIRREKDDLNKFISYFYKDYEYDSSIRNIIEKAKKLLHEKYIEYRLIDNDINGLGLDYKNNDIIEPDEIKFIKKDLSILKDIGRKLIMLEEERKKNMIINNYSQIYFIDKTIGEIHKYIKDNFKKYTKNNNENIQEIKDNEN